MNLHEVTLFENKTHRILNEGYQTLTETQKVYLSRFEKELWPLLEDVKSLFEQNLTTQQIQSIFQNAEQVAKDSGANRSGLGKAGDTAVAGVKLPGKVLKAVNDKVNELGRMAQDSGPVSNMDAKFSELTKNIAANNPDNKIVQGIKAVSNWAKANPGKATLAVGILTAVASVMGGPAGGAAAGFLLRSTKDLLQGEKLSTAVGKAAKTAAIGALAGFAADKVGGFFSGIRGEVIDQGRFADVDYGASKTLSAPGYEWTREIRGVNIKVLPDDAATINNLMDVIGQGGDRASQAFEKLYNLSKEIKSTDYKDMLKNIGAVARENDSLFQWIEGAKTGITALVQGSAASSNNKKESLEADYEQYLKESAFGNIASKAAGLMKTGADKVAKATAPARQAIAQKTKDVGNELGNKVTAKKLQQAWSNLGNPIDTGSIYGILQDAGMDTDLIQAVSVQSDVTLSKENTVFDLKKLAAEIKKSGAAAAIKSQLSGVAAPAVKKPRVVKPKAV